MDKLGRWNFEKRGTWVGNFEKIQRKWCINKEKVLGISLIIWILLSLKITFLYIALRISQNNLKWRRKIKKEFIRSHSFAKVFKMLPSYLIWSRICQYPKYSNFKCSIYFTIQASSCTTYWLHGTYLSDYVYIRKLARMT